MLRWSESCPVDSVVGEIKTLAARRLFVYILCPESRVEHVAPFLVYLFTL